MKHKVEGAPLCAQGSCLGAASPFRKGKQTKGKHPNKTCLDCVVRAVHNSILKTNLPNLRRLEKLEHEREHKSMTEVSARRCMKEFAHPSIYYDMTWDIWVYWSGIIALERGADSTILWGGRVISGPSTDTAPLSAGRCACFELRCYSKINCNFIYTETKNTDEKKQMRRQTDN